MLLYRHNGIAGWTYFFTVTLLDRKSALLVEHIELLREAVQKKACKTVYHRCVGGVAGAYACGMDITTWRRRLFLARWRSIKGYFSHGLTKLPEIQRSNAKGEYGF
jgi:putative transposase